MEPIATLLGQATDATAAMPTDWKGVVLVIAYAILRDGLPPILALFRQKSDNEKLHAELKAKGYDQMLLEMKEENQQLRVEVDKHRNEQDAENAELRQELKAVRQAEHLCQIKQAQQEAQIDYLKQELAFLKQAKA